MAKNANGHNSRAVYSTNRTNDSSLHLARPFFTVVFAIGFSSPRGSSLALTIVSVARACDYLTWCRALFLHGRENLMRTHARAVCGDQIRMDGRQENTDKCIYLCQFVCVCVCACGSDLMTHGSISERNRCNDFTSELTLLPQKSSFLPMLILTHQTPPTPTEAVATTWVIWIRICYVFDPCPAASHEQYCQTSCDPWTEVWS